MKKIISLLLALIMILGLAAYYACTYAVNYFITLIAPGFANANDASISAMLGSSRFLMTVGTVVLVPLAEECLFRGLIFTGLLGKNRKWAYALSVLGFCAVHVLGYLGSADALTLSICFLQYVPSGLVLAWSCEKSGSLFAPILIHAAINAGSILGTL